MSQSVVDKDEADDDEDDEEYFDDKGTPTPQKVRRACKAKMTGMRGLYDDDSEESRRNSPDISISCVALKEEIMGRSFKMKDYGDNMTGLPKSNNDSDLDGDDTSYSTRSSVRITTEKEWVDITQKVHVTSTMRDQLTCAICEKIMDEPSSLICGHSFCNGCIKSWIFDHEHEDGAQNWKCPSCGQRMPITCEDIRVNIALNTCIRAIFGDGGHSPAEKEGAKRSIFSPSENQIDFKVIKDLNILPWVKVKELTTCDIMIMLRRTIVLDNQDKHMQIAMGLYQCDPIIPSVVWDNNGFVVITLCLLTMEEDEVDDSGFPIILGLHSNRHLLVTEERLCGEVGVTYNKDKLRLNESTMAEQQLERNGLVTFHFELKTGGEEETTEVLFLHQVTGLELQLKFYRENMDTLKGDKGREISIESEIQGVAQAHRVNSMEEDDFIVRDESDETESYSDVCCLCGGDGTMIVCDGGSNLTGCGCYFHIECVQRDMIPAGDWICKGCANGIGFNAGVEGHEFKEEDLGKHFRGKGLEDERRKRKNNVVNSANKNGVGCGKLEGYLHNETYTENNDSKLSDDEDEQVRVAIKSGGAKRRCIVDSDDD